ncbi:hypothetical protein HHI36_017601 [Cryptolaemus montrouzieri]|uniref:WHEP-TRS domain-containing protein n=1 Tax=Cryptolaemus montrouzieri TaxID=559131 RepID=A0ABD2NNB7_9CUCU
MVLNEEDYTLLALCNRELNGYMGALEKAKLRDGIRHIQAIPKHGNQYMKSNQPWALLKGSDSYRNSKLVDNNINGDAASIQKLVDEQALLVRKLKEGGKEKAVWQPEVTKLLALKAKLQEVTKKEASSVPIENVKVLEEEIAKQGLLVRKLKEGCAEKSTWQPEVDKLLALKNKLASITGVPVAQPKGKKGKK